ncbi:RecF/RecN/SMC N terminal domain containing protein [Tritrichomonas foetus]|uniref:RecF/RecN/SMC N terminal domain containing protein n=1 Tax=Tritrichomonas foetus TaxID=1144522 RepID=A0A1J4JS62_9EUKA|nr:RecF/RecN/SMC N terminal domain containing protein [Tritrichomonas foetus]|eukprot:OHT00085.1 RecF/RecN/SMC N terminal domain containing protein [Tritrichomonas foetus]
MQNGNPIPPGALISVRMINFMKHDNLLISLNPGANFITGRNGSGKSSILVAISIGLGGTSRISGRGTNLNDLIKDGRNEATIIIEINNSPNGYEEHIFGKKITVTRKIRRGGSTFEISNLPKNRATAREELTKILQFFNIQVDNPCTIMHQDIAREFIGVSSAQRKYELFMKGTLLSRLEDEIHKIEGNILRVQKRREECFADKADLDLQFAKQSRLNDIVEEAGDLVHRIHNIENELTWSYYKTATQQVNEFTELLSDYKEKLNIQKKKTIIKKEEHEKSNSEFNEYKKKVTEELQKLSTIKKEKDKLAQTLTKLRADINQQKSNYKHKKNALERTEIEIQNKKRDLERLMKKKETAAEDSLLKKRQYNAEQEEKQGQTERNLHRVEEDIEQIQNEIRQYNSSYEMQKEAAKNTKNRMNELNEKLRLLKSVSTNNSDYSIQNLIDRQLNRFSYRPTGPIGHFVRLKNPKWGIAVQHVIGKLLESFIVDNYQDERQLRTILKDQIPVIITDFSLRGFSERVRPPAEEAISVFDVIEISNFEIQCKNGHSVNAKDVITNVLVDIAYIDKIWLIENDKRAHEVAFKNRITVLTPDGVTYKFLNGYQMRAGAKYTVCKIGADDRVRIQQTESEIQRMNDDLKHKSTLMNDVEKKIRSLKTRKNELDRQRTDLTKTMNEISVRLQNPPDESDNFDAQINAVEERIDKLNSNLIEHKDALPIIEEKINELKKEKSKFIAQINELNEKLNQTDPFKAESDRLFNQTRRLEKELEHEQKLESNLTERVNKVTEILKTKTNEASVILDKARKHSPECEERYKDTARPTHVLANLLMEERNKYSEAQKLHGVNFHQIRTEYKTIKNQLAEAVKFLAELDEFILSAQNGLKKRQIKLSQLQDSITRRARVAFLSYYSKRKYSGKARFDHSEKTITIRMKNKFDKSYTDVTGLSGGEKSYSLVSLLLSLWEVMDSPFYAVDEFDVFMDDINRQAATNLLISGAKSMEIKQFILITPLSLDYLTRDDDKVSVFEVEK